MLKIFVKSFLPLILTIFKICEKIVNINPEEQNLPTKNNNNKYVRNMNMMKKKLIFFAIFLMGGLIMNQIESFAGDERKWKFHLEPSLEQGSPFFRVSKEGEQQGLDLTIRALTIDTSHTLEKRTIEPANEFVIVFPKVEKNTYIELSVNTIPSEEKPIFVWRTLLFPPNLSTIRYGGKQEMLPPPDFDEYWDKAKKELEAVELVPKITRVPEKDTKTGLLYRVELPTVENTKIVCWYYVPREAFAEDGSVVKKFPAIMIAPGYGAEEPPIDRTEKGYITLSVNPRNHGPSREFWKSPVEHMVYNIDNPEKYYYKLAFLDCLRGVQFLFTRPEVDSELVATEGGSQGGLFAIATAALEPRIKCVCSNVTAFSDYPDGMILGQIGHHSAFARRIIEKSADIENVLKSLTYTDGANMATRVRCPIQINMGGQDPVCHYICGIVVFNRVPQGVKKEYNIIPDIKHEVPQQIRDNNNRWYEKYLKRGNKNLE